MPNFPLYPHQQKMLDELRALSKGDIFIDPRFPGKTTVRQIRAAEMQQVHSIMYGRKHKKKRWMSETYHKRIQKKWDKRYGPGLVTQKQPVIDSVRDLIMAEGSRRVTEDYGCEMPVFLYPGQSTGRVLREPVDLQIHCVRPDGAEATTVMKVLKERKAFPEAFHIQANFTVNSIDIEDKDNDEQKS